MQASEENNSRLMAMMELYDKIGDFIALLCDVKKEDIFSKSKTQPLPICRGFCWYAIRVAFDATYGELSKMTTAMGCHFTSAGISSSVGETIKLSMRSSHWSNVWNKVKAKLPRETIISDRDKGIVIQIIIPKGSKDNIKFEIKEQQAK